MKTQVFLLSLFSMLYCGLAHATATVGEPFECDSLTPISAASTVVTTDPDNPAPYIQLFVEITNPNNSESWGLKLAYLDQSNPDYFDFGSEYTLLKPLETKLVPIFKSSSPSLPNNSVIISNLELEFCQKYNPNMDILVNKIPNVRYTAQRSSNLQNWESVTSVLNFNSGIVWFPNTALKVPGARRGFFRTLAECTVNAVGCNDPMLKEDLKQSAIQLRKEYR